MMSEIEATREKKDFKIELSAYKFKMEANVLVEPVDLFRLIGTTYLNDELIYHMFLWAEKYLADSKDVVFMSPFLTRQYMDNYFKYDWNIPDEELIDPKIDRPAASGRKKIHSYKYGFVKRWFKKKCKGKPLTYDKIIICANPGTNHWTFGVVYVKKKIFEYYDSLLAGNDDMFAIGIFNWFRDECYDQGTPINDNEWTVNYDRASISYQRDGYNCGVYTILRSIAIALNYDVRMVTNEQVERFGRQAVFAIFYQYWKRDFFDKLKIATLKKVEKSPRLSAQDSSFLLKNYGITTSGKKTVESTKEGFPSDQNWIDPLEGDIWQFDHLCSAGPHCTQEGYRLTKNERCIMCGFACHKQCSHAVKTPENYQRACLGCLQNYNFKKSVLPFLKAEKSKKSKEKKKDDDSSSVEGEELLVVKPEGSIPKFLKVKWKPLCLVRLPTITSLNAPHEEEKNKYSENVLYHIIKKLTPPKVIDLINEEANNELDEEDEYFKILPTIRKIVSHVKPPPGDLITIDSTPTKQKITTSISTPASTRSTRSTDLSLKNKKLGEVEDFTKEKVLGDDGYGTDNPYHIPYQKLLDDQKIATRNKIFGLDNPIFQKLNKAGIGLPPIGEKVDSDDENLAALGRDVQKDMEAAAEQDDDKGKDMETASEQDPLVELNENDPVAASHALFHKLVSETMNENVNKIIQERKFNDREESKLFTEKMDHSSRMILNQHHKKVTKGVLINDDDQKRLQSELRLEMDNAVSKAYIEILQMRWIDDFDVAVKQAIKELIDKAESTGLTIDDKEKKKIIPGIESETFTLYRNHIEKHAEKYAINEDLDAIQKELKDELKDLVTAIGKNWMEGHEEQDVEQTPEDVEGQDAQQTPEDVEGQVAQQITDPIRNLKNFSDVLNEEVSKLIDTTMDKLLKRNAFKDIREMDDYKQRLEFECDELFQTEYDKITYDLTAEERETFKEKLQEKAERKLTTWYTTFIRKHSKDNKRPKIKISLAKQVAAANANAEKSWEERRNFEEEDSSEEEVLANLKDDKNYATDDEATANAADDDATEDESEVKAQKKKALKRKMVSKQRAAARKRRNLPTNQSRRQSKDNESTDNESIDNESEVAIDDQVNERVDENKKKKIKDLGPFPGKLKHLLNLLGPAKEQELLDSLPTDDYSSEPESGSDQDAKVNHWTGNGKFEGYNQIDSTFLYDFQEAVRLETTAHPTLPGEKLENGIIPRAAIVDARARKELEKLPADDPKRTQPFEHSQLRTGRKKEHHYTIDGRRERALVYETDENDFKYVYEPSEVSLKHSLQWQDIPWMYRELYIARIHKLDKMLGAEEIKRYVDNMGDVVMYNDFRNQHKGTEFKIKHELQNERKNKVKGKAKTYSLITEQGKNRFDKPPKDVKIDTMPLHLVKTAFRLWWNRQGRFTFADNIWIDEKQYGFQNLHQIAFKKRRAKKLKKRNDQLKKALEERELYEAADEAIKDARPVWNRHRKSFTHEKDFIRAMNTEFPKEDYESQDMQELTSLTRYARNQELQNQKEVEEIGQLQFVRYNKNTGIPAHYKGRVSNGRKGWKECDTPQINPKWVEYYFRRAFWGMLLLNPGKWFPVPIGQCREDIAPMYLSTQVECVFQQKEADYCLFYCLASALHYMGYPNEAKNLAAQAENGLDTDGKSAVEALLAWMELIFPSLAGYQSFGNFNKKKKGFISVKTLCLERSPFPTVVVPLGKDKSLNHAVCVIDDLVFDSTQMFALKLKRKTFDWVVQADGVEMIHGAYRFHRKSNKIAQTVTRGIKTNWR